MKLRCRDRIISLERVAVMGVLNVTPDSFSDGGLWVTPAAAVAHAEDMVSGGAAVVDVGGESTRPGAPPVPEDEEMRRVIPVVEALAAVVDVTISIDTRKPAVALRAIEAGAGMINDTSGEDADPRMDEVAAAAGAAVVVMHSRGTPDRMRSLTSYADVVADVAAFLGRRAEELAIRGVGRDAIVVDPGFGFAKTPAQNLTMLKRFDEFTALGFPVLAGTSRKSFIGETLGLPVTERLEGTAATVAWAVAKGAHVVRVHDVAEVTRVIRMTEAILGAPS